MPRDPYARKLLFFLLIVGVVRIVIITFTGLGPGESYYFRGVHNLQLSYFDQPPLFFWVSGLSVALFGESNFALRLPAVLFFTGTSWLLFVIARRLFSSRAGYFAAILINLSAVFTISVGNWLQPDAPLMFFWLACVYCVLRVLFPEVKSSRLDLRSNRETYIWWILTGVTMGLTTLSKYHVLFLAAGVFLFVITNKTQRHWIYHPGPYIALLINLLFSLPILIWNAQHEWISFTFQGARAGSQEEFRLHFDWFFRSIMGQMVWLTPWVWLPLTWQLIVSFRRRGEEVFGFVFWTAILPIVFFTVITLWSNLQFHFHWQAPGYMMLFIPLGHFTAQNLEGTGKWRRITSRWINASAICTILAIAVLTLHTVTGFWRSYGPKWVAQQLGQGIDPTIEAVDYLDITERFQQEGWLEDENIFIGATRWWLAGKVDWALKGTKEVIVFHRDARNLAYLVDPNASLGKDCIVITRGHQSNIAQYVEPHFAQVAQLEDIWITRSGVEEMKLEVYYCHDFQVPKTPLEDLPVYRQLTGRSPF
ncbi:MAG: glycosyltransferase family 39 protein [Bacteroidota bacterium]